MCICMYVFMHIYISIFITIYICIFILICGCIYIHMCTCVYMYMYLNIYTYVYLCIYIYFLYYFNFPKQANYNAYKILRANYNAQYNIIYVYVFPTMAKFKKPSHNLHIRNISINIYLAPKLNNKLILYIYIEIYSYIRMDMYVYKTR
jgi:hypothetical protein